MPHPTIALEHVFMCLEILICVKVEAVPLVPVPQLQLCPLQVLVHPNQLPHVSPDGVIRVMVSDRLVLVVPKKQIAKILVTQMASVESLIRHGQNLCHVHRLL